MAAILLASGSVLGLLYAASAAAAFAYHWHKEQRFYRVDVGLAWSAIAANCWLAVKSSQWQYTLIGILCILLAIQRYYRAHESDYHYHHTVWHCWCGTAGVWLALGYA
jgi:hypothetical protein